VSSGRHAIYISSLSVFWGKLSIIQGIHVARCREQKGVRLYGKYDYYLIYTENLVRSCGGYNMILRSRDGLKDRY
jgi:hypothetical protein